MDNIEDMFSDDPYIRAIQKEIIAEIERRIDDGRIDQTRQLTPLELDDIERTARANIDLTYKPIIRTIKK